jgi:hypothetical protein
MIKMVKKSPKKIPKIYECTFCNYHTSNKKDYNKHLTTAKHEKIKNGKKSPEKIPKIPKNIYEHNCVVCKRTFKYQSGLSRHSKTCSIQFDENVLKEGTLVTDVNVFVDILKQNQDFKQLLIEQQSENKMFKELIIEQQNENQKLQSQLIDAVKDNGNTVNNITTNNNQKFNLNFFLNTTCKDAMNMSEFIENIEVNFKDIENIGKNGYVSGMTDMILSRIKELDVTKRPMHCTDLKRETMYIKDNNEWTKDTPENTKLHQMIDYVAKQNYAKMPLWRQRNPECLDSDHPKYDFCIKMMTNMLGDVGAEQKRLDNKVIKNLSRHILVEKT